MNPVVLVSLGLVALVVGVTLGRVRENYYLDHRYVSAVAPPLGGGFRSTPEWQPLQDWGRNARDERIGVVGRASAFGQYFFYGTDLSNHVQYVGTELNRGTFRPIVNCELWRQTVNQGHYRFIVTTPKIGALEINAPPEALWTSSDPNVSTVVNSGPAAVYRINGPLDPSACSKLGAKAHV